MARTLRHTTDAEDSQLMGVEEALAIVEAPTPIATVPASEGGTVNGDPSTRHTKAGHT